MDSKAPGRGNGRTRRRRSRHDTHQHQTRDMESEMRVAELPGEWSPAVDLETVGYLEGSLDTIAGVAGLTLHSGQDHSPPYAPIDTYVMTLPELNQPERLIMDTVTALGLAREQVHWHSGS